MIKGSLVAVVTPMHEDGTLRFAGIRTGAEDPDGRVQVLEGLAAGDAGHAQEALECCCRVGGCVVTGCA